MDQAAGSEAYSIRRFGDIIGGNSYPGRGIIAGQSEDGSSAVTAYFIMGRSENSRNRVFVKEDGMLRTEAADPDKVSDPSLIIYTAVRQSGGFLVVTNGDHTDTICRGHESGIGFFSSLETRSFEPDAPNFTPRISAELDLGVKSGSFTYRMSILRSADAAGSSCLRAGFEYESMPGTGHLIHTYERDADPLPPFSGEPRGVVIGGDIDDLADEIWSSLDADNRISLYVRYTGLSSGKIEEQIINKYERI